MYVVVVHRQGLSTIYGTFDHGEAIAFESLVWVKRS